MTSLDDIFYSNAYPYTNYQMVNLDFIFDILKALAGGSTGEVLSKKTDDDYSFIWSAGGGGGGGVVSVNGQTGVVVLRTSDITNNSGYVNAAGAASAAPVQSVNGQTGAVTVSVPSASNSLPANLAATAAVGTGTTWARSNHVHKLPTASEVGAMPAVTGTTSGQVLTWNGSAWVAQALPLYSGGVG